MPGEETGKKIGDAYIKISPAATDFASKTKSEVSEGMKGAESSVSESVGHMKETLKTVAEAAGVAFGVEKVIEFGKSVFEAGEENAKLAAQTQAVIKSTGGAAGVTSKQIDDLSMSISKQTAVSDDAITNGENLLLTFTNIKNGVGQGNDVFNQATKTLIDMSVALGQQPQQAAIQLGKALNDPVQGITALTRVGVTFTDQQKAQIKAMVDAGHTADAQKLILHELNREFGGSADAQATATDKLKNYVSILEEELGGKLLPIIDKVAEWLMDKLPGALDFAGKAFNDIKTFVEPIIQEWMPRLIKVWRDDLQPILEKVANFIGEHLKPILLAVGIAIGIMAAPVTTVIAAFVVLYARFAVVREIVAEVVKILGAFVRFIEVSVVPVVRRIAEYVGQQFQHIALFVKSHMAAVQEAIGHVVNVIRAIIQAAIAIIVRLWDMFGNNLLKIAGIVWSQVQNVIQTAIRIIRDVINLVLSLINGDWGKAWNAVKDIFGAIWDFIVKSLRNELKLIGQLLEIGLKAVGALFSAAWSAITSALGGFISQVVGFFSRLPGDIMRAIARISGDILGFFGKVFSDLVGAVIHGTQNVVSWFISLPNAIIHALGDIDHLLVNAGERIIKGLINGFKNMFGSVKHTLGGLAHDLVSWKGPPEYDSVLLTDNGERVISGFVQGIKNKTSDVKKALQDVTSTVAHAQIGVTASGPAQASSNSTGSWPGNVTINVKGVFDFTTANGARQAAIAINKALSDYQRERAA